MSSKMHVLAFPPVLGVDQDKLALFLPSSSVRYKSLFIILNIF